jgi:Na+/melibiose symporter-like transporter
MLHNGFAIFKIKNFHFFLFILFQILKALFYYYAPFVVIFQFGWASTQISHLSLIPQLTSDKNERVALNAIRYAFTVMSNLFVYGITYLLLRLNQMNQDDSDENISRQVRYCFKSENLS